MGNVIVANLCDFCKNYFFLSKDVAELFRVVGVRLDPERTGVSGGKGRGSLGVEHYLPTEYSC